MKLTTVKEIYRNREQYLDKEITVGGWVRSVRDSKAFGFIVLHDGSFFETLQIVYHDNMENFAEVSKLNVGAAIIVKGTLVATPQAKQPFEIQATEVSVEGTSAPDYPLQKKRHSLEYLRTMTHLRPRTNTFQAVFRVRSLCAYAIHKFFQERGFVYVHTPLITGSDCEGAGEMFQVTTLDPANMPMTEDGKVDYSQDFFGKETNLTVSGQLNGETYAQAFRPDALRFVQQSTELDRRVAENAGVWRLAAEIRFGKRGTDALFHCLAAVGDRERNGEGSGGLARGVRAGETVIEIQPVNLQPRFAQQVRGHGGIHAAGETENDLIHGGAPFRSRCRS